MDIISALFHFTIDPSRLLGSLSSSITSCTLYDLAVLLVSSDSIHSSQLANHVVGNEQKKMVITSASNIIYWDEQCRMFYPSSCLFMYFFIQRGSSSITSQKTCFSVPSGLCMTEPEGFHCAGVYIFVQKTICFE